VASEAFSYDSALDDEEDREDGAVVKSW
jgi:hypothetical protein